MTSKKEGSLKGPGLPSLSDHRLRPDSSAEGMSLAEYLSRELLIAEDLASDVIDFGSVQVAGRQERNPGAILRSGNEIRVCWPRGGPRRHYEVDPLRIIHRDRLLLAYNKEAGTPSQQTPSDAYNNLFAALQRYLLRESPSAGYIALHHRLDRETSGIMLFAIDREANRRLGLAFQRQKLSKDYLAWIAGIPGQDRWVSTEDIGRKGGRYCTLPKGDGKSAETSFQVLHREGDRTLLWARPRTGRTHQIRLHLAAMGIPILGDRPYGGPAAERLYLHAFRLILPHPDTGARLTLVAPAPHEWNLPDSFALQGGN